MGLPARLVVRHSRVRSNTRPGLLLHHRATIRLYEQQKHAVPFLRLLSSKRNPSPPIDDLSARDRPDTSSGNSYTKPAEQLSQHVTPAEKAAYRHAVADQREKQARAPWMRAGAEIPPAEKLESSSTDDSESKLNSKADNLKSATKIVARGKLLTTPSRLLKLIVPMVSVAEKQRLEEEGKGDEGLEPLALLVHPQQPLSYLERLIQAELPMVSENGKEPHVPEIAFSAPDADAAESDGETSKSRKDQNLETMIIDGKRVKIGKVSGGKAEVKETEGSEEEGQDVGFVRWSSSTELGDFIRDAAQTGHFALRVEGTDQPILIAVPNFHDRTFYLRMRLRQRGREIARLADVKKECDDIAEKGAKRIALTGGAALIAYWWIVYLCTFKNPDLGWDVMEPVTYLVGLSTLIAGYVWFLVNNRQVSYRSAMNFTISRRQSTLYEQKGFDLQRWEDLVDEGNRLRREIKLIAEEYDVTWNEKEEDPETEKAIKALEEEKKKKNKAKGKDEDDEEKED